MNENEKKKKDIDSFKRTIAIILSATVLGTPISLAVAKKVHNEYKKEEIIQIDEKNSKNWHATDAFVFWAPYNGGGEVFLYFKDGHKDDLISYKEPGCVDDTPVWINCADLFINFCGMSKDEVENNSFSENELISLSMNGMNVWWNSDFDPSIEYERYMDSNMFDELAAIHRH